MAYTFSALKDEYTRLWATCTVTRTGEATKEAKAIVAGKVRLQDAEKACGMPWFVIGCLIVREAGLTAKGVVPFGAYLGNGQHIIGTSRLSTIVPAGRGPFPTFNDGCVDAVAQAGLKGFDWYAGDGPARLAYAAEKFNGFGYRSKGLRSPYLWGATNHQQAGKYVTDHVWSSSTVDPQTGVMATLKTLQELDPTIAFVKSTVSVPPAPVTPSVVLGGTAVASTAVALPFLPGGDYALGAFLALGVVGVPILINAGVTVDKDRLMAVIRHLFSAGGPGLAILIMAMTQWGVPAEQQSWALQAIAWALGAGGPIIGVVWGFVVSGLSSRIKSVQKIKGLEVHVDTDRAPPTAVDLAMDTSPELRGVVPVRK